MAQNIIILGLIFFTSAELTSSTPVHDGVNVYASSKSQIVPTNEKSTKIDESSFETSSGSSLNNPLNSSDVAVKHTVEKINPQDYNNSANSYHPGLSKQKPIGKFPVPANGYFPHHRLAPEHNPIASRWNSEDIVKNNAHTTQMPIRNTVKSETSLNGGSGDGGISNRFGGDSNCVHRCPTTSQYNPICGDDGITYTNLQKFHCAQNCGFNVKQLHPGACMSNTAG